MSLGSGRSFWKMTGSGNDFVFFDVRGRTGVPDPLETSAGITALCASHLGVGADGVVFIDKAEDATFTIRYYNADGTRAALCGNASLCAAQSAVHLGLARRAQLFHFTTDAGRIQASIDAEGLASVRLAPVTALEVEAVEGTAPREERIGFAVVGVPHLVVLVGDVGAIDVTGRGRILRHSVARLPAGANVNFVSIGESVSGGPWRIRTFERGVEGETYACGTGSVATAALLQAWGLAPGDGPVSLLTASGRTLTVQFPEPSGAGWSELSGEGRIVFEGVLRTLR